VTAALRLGAMLSLTGRFAQFGTQAARGLETWRDLTERVEIVVEDDGGDPDAVHKQVGALAARCDLLLGPYSTLLTRAAAEAAADGDHVLWNHGGSGDDVQAAAPGHVLSILSPTSRYAEPVVRHLAGQAEQGPLVLVQGRGRFGRQVVAGAEQAADRLGLRTIRADPDTLPTHGQPWDLFSAGTFKEDVALVAAARAGPLPPRTIGTVAAGVREFHDAVPDSDGVLGVAQWFPGSTDTVEIGPSEEAFLTSYDRRTSAIPDYPAVQAAAAAALAVHCAEAAGGLARDDLWAAATSLRTSTMFGDFAVDVDGTQTAHRMAMVRWTGGRLTAVSGPGPPARRTGSS
jgi:ABC-type branched-subunit amino acid transport system substrate-binding protein